MWNILYNGLLHLQTGKPLNAMIQGYADDTVIVLSHANQGVLQDHMNEILTQVHEWSKRVNLIINYGKCNCILFPRGNPLCKPPAVNISNSRIKYSTTIKYLGLLLDHKLLWKDHIQEAYNKAHAVSHALATIAKNKWGLKYKARRATYQAVTQQIVAYGCEVWGHRINTYHTRRKLLSLQRLAALYTARAYRTAPTDGLLVLSNLTPIDLYITERYVLHMIKRLGRNNITQEQFWNRTKNLVEGDTIPNIIKLISDRGMDITDASIYHPAFNPRYSITMDNNIPNNSDYNIYTDGSHSADGTGGAFVVLDRKERTTYQQYFKLESYCTINQAESLALLKALQHINNKNHIYNYDHKSIAIHTDSRVILHQVHNRNSKLPIIKNILHELDTTSCPSLVLRWVRGHSGVKGNVQADLLAKKAITNLNNCAYNRIPQCWVSRQLHSYIIDQWEYKWTSSTTGRTVFQFIPSVKKRLHYHHLVPTYELTQLITGHGNMGSYLVRFLNKGNGLCSCSSMTWEDSNHILYDCPNYDRERRTLIAAACEETIPWPCKPDNLISNKNLYSALDKYVKDIKIFS
ncbi:uncharacterized protein [Centruroides vittatus]|uniref:uncharacterized protein n=1 Tax=Centruroides vittatus TaxID=120091 RepID=UPI00350EAEF1